MERNDVKVGQDYLYFGAPYDDWKKDHHSNKRVVVIDTSHGWRDSKTYVNHPQTLTTDSGTLEIPWQYQQDMDKKGILVQVGPRYQVVQARYLKAPYDEAIEVIERERRRRRAAREEDERKAKEERARGDSLVEQLKTHGFNSARLGLVDRGLVLLSYADAERLIEHYERRV